MVWGRNIGVDVGLGGTARRNNSARWIVRDEEKAAIPKRCLWRRQVCLEVARDNVASQSHYRLSPRSRLGNIQLSDPMTYTSIKQVDIFEH